MVMGTGGAGPPVLAGTDAGYALSLALLVSVVYLAVVRFMDLNEKEPLWAMGLVFLLGAGAAVLLRGLVDSDILELGIWPGSVAEEVAKFVALGVAVATFAAVARWRGWAEVGGVMDGVIYGMTVGLGFATGTAFVREVTVGSDLLRSLGGGGLAALWSIALSGLAQGLFGAVAGAGFGATAQAASALRRWAYPPLALAAAVAFHAGYLALSRGGALGSGGAARKWAALAIPVVFVAAVVVLALAREKQALHGQLLDEATTGTVTPAELAVLRSFTARRLRYVRRFLRGDFDGWLALRVLQNRQVQLALAKQRVARQTEPARRAQALAEVEQLRVEVAAARREFERVGDVDVEA